MPEQIPLLDQYRRIKLEQQDAILFFRLGDFYEMFFRDAIEASALLSLTLTHRQDAPMCGIPHHAARGYIAKLLKAGKKVAICEQIGTPGKGKGIIERAVTEVISPGSVVDDDLLDARTDNYLLALGRLGESVAMAWADASTGEFRACSFPATDMERLGRELYRLAPKEVLIRQSSLEDSTIAGLLEGLEPVLLNRFPDWIFSLEQGLPILLAKFETRTMKGFGFDDQDPALAAAGVIVDYLSTASRLQLDHISALMMVNDDAYMSIDESTQRNLEIERNLRDAGRTYTLLDILDHTRTAMGARALRRRLTKPLKSVDAIRSRLDAVEAFYKDQRYLERSREILGRCLDMERLASRLSMDKAGPRDLIAIRETLRSALTLEGETTGSIVLATLRHPVLRPEIEAVVALLDQALLDEPALLIHEGNIIKAGWHAGLDDLRNIKTDARAILEAYVEEERTTTGLPGLRVRYNKIIGYYLELSKTAAERAPAHFIRRQSLSTGERYSTIRLNEIESRINGATESIAELEKDLFLAIQMQLKSSVGLFFELAREIAELDCAASMAWVATTRGYTKPQVNDSRILHIREGRHPVVEAHLPPGDFVPNDTDLDAANQAFALITGPNMAGKSTYLRQTALIVIMTQAGSFVPAREAQVGIVDKVFCRVGAQDNLAKGESTFLLEMHETASILHNASPRSLVIMDEVGRGTSTLDGLSIAWAVSEYMLDHIACRALFATHFHELTALQHVHLVDLSMAVDERAGDVVFLKRVVQGPAKGSYGIHVARLAGIPSPVVERASRIKDSLESGEQNLQASMVRIPPTSRKPADNLLFSPEDLVLTELLSMKLETMTPLDALNRLASLKKNLQDCRQG